MLKKRQRKLRGPKRVSYELIPRDTISGAAMHKRLRLLVESRHTDLVDARFALAWCTSWKGDVDGRIKLGMCKKASDLDRQLAPYDFVILLAKWFWDDVLVSDLQRQALLDHELWHAAVKCDEHTGQPVHDEQGRMVYRIRKHDVEEFHAVVEEFGLWKRDLELQALAIHRSALRGFVPCDKCKDHVPPGWVELEDRSVRKCECYVAWLTRLNGETPTRLFAS